MLLINRLALFCLTISLHNTTALAQGLPDFSLTATVLGKKLEQAVQDYQNQLAGIDPKQASWNNTIQPLSDATNEITTTWSLLTQLTQVSNNREITNTYNDIRNKITGFYKLAMSNKDLYQTYVKINSSAEFSQLSPQQQTSIQQMLLYFKLSGVALDEKKQIRHWEILQRLAKLSASFNDNLQQSRINWQYKIEDPSILDGLPENYRNNLLKQGYIDLQNHNVAAVMMYAKNRALRETIYHAFNNLANTGKFDNSKIVPEFLQLRQELAQLLGFSNYAEYTLANRQGLNSEQVVSFLQDLAQQVTPVANKELAQIQAFARQQDNIEKLAPWDLVFYSQAYKEQQYLAAELQAAQYLDINKTLKTLFNLVALLYDIKIIRVTDASTWHPDVEVFMLQDKQKNIISYFYLDLYARDDKQEPSSVINYTERALLANNQLQLPITFINTNFNRTKKLHTIEAADLFNQFGRMLEYNLSNNTCLNLSGFNNLNNDAIDLAGNFNQNWLWNYLIVRDIGNMPLELFNQLKAANRFSESLSLLSQINLALFDFQLALNVNKEANNTPLKLWQAINQQISPLPDPSDINPVNRYDYIFANMYKADYYVTIWTQMLANTMYEYFKPNQGFNPNIGNKFLNTVLSQGGQRSVLALSKDFLEHNPVIKYTP